MSSRLYWYVGMVWSPHAVSGWCSWKLFQVLVFFIKAQSSFLELFKHENQTVSVTFSYSVQIVWQLSWLDEKTVRNSGNREVKPPLLIKRQMNSLKTKTVTTWWEVLTSHKTRLPLLSLFPSHSSDNEHAQSLSGKPLTSHRFSSAAANFRVQYPEEYNSRPSEERIVLILGVHFYVDQFMYF